MSKLKVSIINPSTLRLEEDGKVGDIIDLQELVSVDNTLILDAINKGKDEQYNVLLSREREQQEANKKLALNELEKKLNLDKENLSKEKDKLQLLVDSIDEKLLNERKTTTKELNAEFSIEKIKLENKIQELEKSIENQKNLVKLETEKNKNEEISNLKIEIEKIKASERELLQNKDNEIRLLNEQLKNKDELKKAELEKEVSELKKTFSDDLNKKEIELNQLRMSKSNLQVKMLGEELEKWCNAEYESYALSGFENCKWFKDNVSVKDSPDEKGTKADYIFEVYADDKKEENDKLLSVCCEMKNESPETKNKTKNSDHYDKLDKDRKRKNCQYSLLISELEWDTVNDAPIKKVPNYENMYMVRPAYFVSFLSLLKSLANKYQDLLLEHKETDEKFKESQAIIDEFESFKSTYLDKPLQSLLNDVEKIKTEANKAYEASYKIVGLADTIISNKISEIKVKIDRFDIRKIARRVDKI